MDADALAEQLLADPDALEQLNEPLPDHVAAAVVARLKAEADRHWWINANRSLEIADLISRVGQQRNDAAQLALAQMARGNAQMFLGRATEAWNCFEQAGALYMSVGDELGWARTRIGRLLLCVDLNRVGEALSDAARAESISQRLGEREALLRLNLNTAIVHGSLGQHDQALKRFHDALSTAKELGSDGEAYLGPLHTNIGHVYDLLGNLQRAQEHHVRAREIFERRSERRGIAVAEANHAHILMCQGHHRSALRILYRSRELYLAEGMSPEAANAGQLLVECNLLLNRYSDAQQLAQQIAGEYEALGSSYQQALTLVHQATAEAELGEYDDARSALDRAEALFQSLGAETWTARVRLRRGRIALKLDELAEAFSNADLAANAFRESGQQVDLARALVLKSQLRLARGELDQAAADARCVVGLARASSIPELRYAAHLVLGKVADHSGRFGRAERHLRAATAMIDRAQRGLTITLRPGFLQDKGEALRELITLRLREGKGASALQALEHAKSQALLSYLANRERLRWPAHDQESRALVDKLNSLREEHHRLYRLAYEPTDTPDQPRHGPTTEQVRKDLAIRERRMRTLTEQLYLAGQHEGLAPHAGSFRLEELQRRLDDSTLLIEYFDDGSRLWAFSVDARSLEVHQAAVDLALLGGLLRQLQLNISAALATNGSTSMTQLARRILQRLYGGLIAPLKARLQGYERLMIVPFGTLHYLPFHLLDAGGSYLFEQHEVVVLPTAALATRSTPQRRSGAQVITHSWDGRLPHTHAEGALVQQILGGELFEGQHALRSRLAQAPTQVLHIAAHGQHRLDQPELSYIELADGQMYTDDLLQHDLSYELVTLSACETGRAQVAAGDELIGLGRGFLYAGAGALITSLWRVADEATVPLMQRLYSALRAGDSKASALRNAQRAILEHDPGIHPALWGAFQLVGDAGPLSTNSSTAIPLEAVYEETLVATK